MTDQRLVDKWLEAVEMPPKCSRLDNRYYCLGCGGPHCEGVGRGKVYSCDVSMSVHVFHRLKNRSGVVVE